jgi:GT2 family glycosyltransferase
MLTPAAQADASQRYARWIFRRGTGGPQPDDYRERARTLWKIRPLFEIFLFLKAGDEALLADSIDSLAGQYYNGWRLSIFAPTPSPEAELTHDGSPVRWFQVSGDAIAVAEAANARLLASAADWIGFFECGARFAPDLLLACGDYIALHPGWRLIYTDEDAFDADGTLHSPLFKPDFNLELLRSTDYIGSLLAERKALISAGGYPILADATCYDLALRVADACGERSAGHIPEVLQHVPSAAFRRAGETDAVTALGEHLARRGIDAEILPGLLENRTRRVLYRHPGTPKVSIVVPTRNRLELLVPCMESLFRHTAWPDWELLLVDNGSDDPNVPACYDALRTLLGERVRILDFPGSFNFSAMNNLAARKARGDYLLLLNNDTECIHDDWLDALMAHAQRPGVGIVGARLLFPASLKVQHAGVVLGMTGTAGLVFAQALAHDEPGYLGRAQADQEYSAVTGACLLIRKSLFDEIGGLDEDTFKISFNDIDLCLKARQRGYRVVWTPFATLLHHGSASQIEDARNPAKKANFQNECNEFYTRWRQELADDPAWNRNLSLNGALPVVEDELAVPWQRDLHDRPRIAAIPLSSQGAAEYRCFAPLRALHAAGRIHYAAVCQPRAGVERAPMPVELTRMAPDTLLMHAPADNVRCLALLRYPRSNPELFRVYTLDDLITHLPKDNPVYSKLPADVVTERLALGLEASHRLIVSTEPLAEACRHLIDDIHVVPNTLSWASWGSLQSARRRGKKLRVGWAGAQQHGGDLRFLLDVLKATHTEVDWVFFGMLPDELKPFVAEFHDYIHDFAAYPAKLASLDLDLAVAPLEMHPFNEAKSNLRLLEYGALGWPVICTDIFPYQTNRPPVTRLANDAARWIAAIRERVAEPDALAREGDALRAWVEEHYRLEQHLDLWLRALLPG